MPRVWQRIFAKINMIRNIYWKYISNLALQKQINPICMKRESEKTFLRRIHTEMMWHMTVIPELWGAMQGILQVPAQRRHFSETVPHNKRGLRCSSKWRIWVQSPLPQNKERKIININPNYQLVSWKLSIITNLKASLR